MPNVIAAQPAADYWDYLGLEGYAGDSSFSALHKAYSRMRGTRLSTRRSRRQRSTHVIAVYRERIDGAIALPKRRVMSVRCR